MRIYNSIEELVGRTPLLALRSYARAEGLEAVLLAKLESFEPTGSAKARAALFMLEDAEARGRLRPGGVIIEPTSGNMGIALAALSAPRGYRVILTMPESMSAERRKLLSAYGAELVLTPAAEGMTGAVKKAEELAASLPGSFIPGQFENPANPSAHYGTTGPEIWADTDGKVDLFVAGVGTGGTLTGAGRYLKEKNSAVRVVAVEPASSPLLSGGRAGPHPLQGIGADFVPENLDRAVYDEVMPVEGGAAYAACRALARREGLLVGITAGAAVAAATVLARREENRGRTIVALLPDTGERYLSAGVFD